MIPKAFVSYAWSAQPLAIALAEQLRRDGIDVVIDVWELKPGQDKYQYMERMVSDTTVTHVLVLCDKTYKQKADERRPSGVSDETLIITPEVYARVAQTKFIPIVLERGETGESTVPAYLKSRIHIDLSASEGDGYEQLLRTLYDKPKFEKPPLGSRPSFLDADGSEAIARSRCTEARHAALRLLERGGLVLAKKAIQDMLVAVAEEVANARVSARNDDGVPFDEVLVQRIADQRPTRDDYIAVLDAWCRHSADDTVADWLPEFLESLLRVCHNMPEGVNTYPSTGFEAAQFLSMELALYTITLLVKHRKLKAIYALLSDSFVVSSASDDRVVDYGAFSFHLDEIESRRKRRLNVNRTSLVADLLKERLHSSVTFAELQESELLLFLRGHFLQKRHWRPQTLVYVNLFPSPFQLFLGARSERRFSIIRTFLEVSSVDEFAAKFEACFPVEHRTVPLGTNSWRQPALVPLLALDKLFPGRFSAER